MLVQPPQNNDLGPNGNYAYLFAIHSSAQNSSKTAHSFNAAAMHCGCVVNAWDFAVGEWGGRKSLFTLSLKKITLLEKKKNTKVGLSDGGL